MLAKLLDKIKTEQDINNLKVRARDGHASAQTLIGLCYATGKIPSPTTCSGESMAINYYVSAAKQGYATAQLLLGVCYLMGTGIPKNEKQAITWLELAAAQEAPNAYTNLGQCYQAGVGVDLDLNKAMQYYEMAVEKGITHIKFFLVTMMIQFNHQRAYDLAFKLCAEAEMTDKDFEKAMNVILEHALKGHEKSKEFLLSLARIKPELQMSFASCYFEENQCQEAIEFLKLAALNKHQEAQLLLGIFYRRGQYVEKDPVKAKQYYLEAVNQGNADAQCLLGMFFLQHDGNFSLGVKHLQEAADLGQMTAKKILKRLKITSEADPDQLQDQAFSPDYPNFKLGIAYQASSDYVMAEFHYQIAIEEENGKEALKKLFELHSLGSQESISKAEKSSDVIFEAESAEAEDVAHSFWTEKTRFEKEKEKEDKKNSDSEENSDDQISFVEAKAALMSFNRVWAQPAIQNQAPQADQTPQVDKVSGCIKDPKPAK